MAVLISLKKPLGASVIVFKTFQDFWKLPTGTGLLHSIWTTPGRAMKAGALLAGCERPSLRAPSLWEQEAGRGLCETRNGVGVP